jgi:hypothetical protein
MRTVRRSGGVCLEKTCKIGHFGGFSLGCSGKMGEDSVFTVSAGSRHGGKWVRQTWDNASFFFNLNLSGFRWLVFAKHAVHV